MPKRRTSPRRRVAFAQKWADLPGFVAWFKREAPKLTNKELEQRIATHFKVDAPSDDVISHLRRRYGVLMNSESRARAISARAVGTWNTIPGFADWLRAEAPKLTNPELAEKMTARFSTKISTEAAGSLRRRYGVGMDTEARQRTAASRAKSNFKLDKPSETPQEKMDRDMLTRHVKALSARQTLYEVIGERVVASVGQLAALPPVRPLRLVFPKDQSKEEMVLVISDVQAGQVVNAKEMGGLGNFNSNVLIQEIDNLQEAVLRIRRYHPNVRKIHVPFVGDIVEGNTIYQGQLRSVDANVIEQVIFCVEHFARMLHFLCHLFDEVECYGVIGNHGRIGLKGELSPMANFDYLIYKWLEERLRTVKQVKWAIPDTWWQIMPVLGWRFLLVHGDNAGSSYGSIPYYAVTRHATKYQNLFRTMKRIDFPAEVGNIGVPQEIGDGFDVMICGHFSTAAILNTPGGLVIMNGSFPGGTELSLKSMQLGDIPSQTLFAVHQKWGVTWHRHINLKPLVGR